MPLSHRIQSIHTDPFDRCNMQHQTNSTMLSSTNIAKKSDQQDPFYLSPSPINRIGSNISRVRTFTIDSDNADEGFEIQNCFSRDTMDDIDDRDVNNGTNGSDMLNLQQNMTTTWNHDMDIAQVTPEERRDTVEISNPKQSLFLDDMEATANVSNSMDDGDDLSLKLPTTNSFGGSCNMNSLELNMQDLEGFGLDEDFDPIPFQHDDSTHLSTPRNNDCNELRFENQQKVNIGQVYDSMKEYMPLPRSLKSIVCLLLHMEASTDNEQVLHRACSIVQEMMKSYQPGLTDQQVSGTFFEALVGSLGSTVNFASLFEASAKNADPENIEMFFEPPRDDVVFTSKASTEKHQFVPNIIQLSIAYGAYHWETQKDRTTNLKDFVLDASQDFDSMTPLQKKEFWKCMMSAQSLS